MKGFVGVTDNDSFALLSHQPEIDEINEQLVKFLLFLLLGIMSRIEQNLNCGATRSQSFA
jgi:hypothetical protein